MESNPIESSFKSEVLFILRGLEDESNSLFIYDKDLEFEIKRIFKRLNFNKSREEKSAINLRLLELFDFYQMGMIRVVLKNLHLQNITNEISLQFQDLFIKINHVIRDKPHIEKLVLSELDDFSKYQQEATNVAIVSILYELQLSSEKIDIIYKSRIYSKYFKNLVFKICCQNNIHLFESTAYLNSCLMEPYPESIEINELSELYLNYGYSGLSLFIKHFLRNKLNKNNIPLFSAIKLIASFGTDLHDWLYKEASKPYIQLIDPILYSLENISYIPMRNKLISLLINTWYSNSELANPIKNKIARRLILDETFLNLFYDNTRQQIVRFVSLSEIEKTDQKLIANVYTPNKNHNTILNILNNLDGNQLSYILLALEFRKNKTLFDKYIILCRKDYKRHVFNRWYNFGKIIYKPQNFQLLNINIQNALVLVFPFNIIARQYYLSIKCYLPYSTRNKIEIINNKK